VEQQKTERKREKELKKKMKKRTWRSGQECPYGYHRESSQTHRRDYIKEEIGKKEGLRQGTLIILLL